MIAGAFQLLQLQEDVRRQFKMDGSGPENDVESHLRLNKDTLTNSLWKLNVVDIEVTLLHVCQMVIYILFMSSLCALAFLHEWILFDSFCQFNVLRPECDSEALSVKQIYYRYTNICKIKRFIRKLPQLVCRFSKKTMLGRKNLKHVR